MRYAFSGALAAATTLALTSTAFAQSAGSYYQYGQPAYGQVGTTIAPAATSTYQTPTTAQPTTGSTLYPPATSYAPQPSTTYAPQASATYAPPSGSTYAPQQVGTTYATSPSPQPTNGYTTTAPSYAQPTASATPTQAPSTTYTAPAYGSAQTPSYQAPSYPAPNYQAAMPSYQPPATTQAIFGQPLTQTSPSVTAYTPPASTTFAADQIEDTDAWSYNLARFYPAVQACLRKNSAKNPVIANIQERGSKTMMLIGEGGSSNYSTCSTGLSGTVVKANTETRNLPPAFFAPIGSTFTVTPDRPFQPIVDTNQKVIGWLVRTQPSQGVNQFGQAAGFDGQFIPPMMVNTEIGKS